MSRREGHTSFFDELMRKKDAEYEEQKRFGVSLVKLNELINARPYHTTDRRLTRAAIYLSRGDTNSAKEDYRVVIECSPVACEVERARKAIEEIKAKATASSASSLPRPS